MSDYRVQMRVKNNRIMEAFEAAGYKTVAALCRASGLPQTSIGQLVNFKKSPLNKDSTWCLHAQQLADFLFMDVNDLFSEAQKNLVVKRNTAEKTYSETQMLQMVNDTPEMLMLKSDVKTTVADVIDTHLTPREKIIIQGRFGIGGAPRRTVEEFAQDYDVSQVRIRQIEQNALLKLSQAKYSDAYRHYMDSEEL